MFEGKNGEEGGWVGGDGWVGVGVGGGGGVSGEYCDTVGKEFQDEGEGLSRVGLIVANKRW